MPGRTFDEWLTFSNDFRSKDDIAGRYGVDFRTPEPSCTQRQALRFLSELQKENPRLIKVNGDHFDYLDTTQSAPGPNLYRSQPLSNDPFPTLTKPFPSATLRSSVQAINFTTPRRSAEKNTNSPESDTTTSATPRVQSDFEFNNQYGQITSSRANYNSEDWMSPLPYHSITSMHIQSPISPVPPSPSTFSQSSERSPLSDHAEKPTPSYISFPQNSAAQQSSISQRQHNYLGGNNHTPLMSTVSNSAKSLSGSSFTGRARAPSAPVYPQLHMQVATSAPTFSEPGTGPISSDTPKIVDISSGRNFQNQPLRPSYGRSSASGPVFGTSSSSGSDALHSGMTTPTNAFMQQQTQVGAYGYRYPVTSQAPSYQGFTSVPGPSSLPSLTSGSSASSYSSGASATGDTTWARIPAAQSTSALQSFSLQATGARDESRYGDDSGVMDEDEDTMGGWGRVSDPPPHLSGSQGMSGMYVAAAATSQNVYRTHESAVPLGFHAPLDQS